MRKWLMALAAMIFLSLSGPAVAGPLDGLPVIEGESVPHISNVLSYLPYLADGKDTGQYVYVLYSPTCDYCAALWEETRQWKGDRPQIRWIMFDSGLDFTSVYEDFVPETLAMMFEEEAIPQDKHPKRNKQIGIYTGTTLAQLFQLGLMPSDDGTLLFPGIIICSPDKIWMQAGMPDNWKDVLASAPKGTPLGKQPNLMNHAGKEVKILPVKKRMAYTNQSDQTFILKPAPYDDAPSVGSIPKGHSFEAQALLGATEDGYVLLGRKGFITSAFKDPDFAKKLTGQ